MKSKSLYIVLILTISFSFLSVLSCTYKEKKISLGDLKTEESSDSISYWITSAKDKSYSLSKRKSFIQNAYQSIHESKIDTLQIKRLSSIAYLNLKLGDTLLFKTRNKETLTLAEKLRDSFTIGDTHWNYASYYNRLEVYDSAYYHFSMANKFFEKKGYLFEAAKTQYGMAFIKGRFKDYSGSEVLTFRAIEKFKKLEDYKSLYSCYNHLGSLQKDIQEYDRALFYHEKAIDNVLKVKSKKLFYRNSLNNIGNIYLKKGEYNKAISYFNEVLLNDSLKSQDISGYARVIDNKGYCKLLMKDTINVIHYLKESLDIRDSLNNKGGIIISKIHLSKYYAFTNDTSTAITYLKEANTLSKEIKNSRDYLESLSLLAKLDKKNAHEYLEKHILFSDSIQTVERKIQNKFTRIAYETDEYIEKTKRLAQQKLWIIAISLALFSILILLYYLNNQKSKNEKLLLENDQQKANEQIYIITLKQQEKFEKERVKERNRISEELHDGILGKLFGTRVGLGFLEINTNENIKRQHQKFLDELQQIEKEIREVSHKLNANFDSSEINFINIIYQLLKTNSKIGGYTFQFHYDENIDWQKTNEIVKVNLFRIIQEAIQNIVKYAYAKNVSLNFFLKKDDLLMVIKDDGVGFHKKRKRIGIGIKNMKSRVEKLNGTFNIISILKKGTTIEVLIPIKKNTYGK